MKINYVFPMGMSSGGTRTFVGISKRLTAKGHEISMTFLAKPLGAFQWPARIHYSKIDGFR